MFNLRHLKTLVALRQFGSLAKAAQHLHLTQSALSHQLNELESRLDLRLVHRRSRPVQFSHAGRRLLDLADSVLPQWEAARVDIQQIAHGHSGRLHIVIECHSCFEWLLPTIEHYRGHWPDVEIDLSLAHSFEPMQALLREDVDLVITSDRRDMEDLQFSPLFRYQGVLVMANDHGLTGKTFIQPKDLSGETLITYPVDAQRLDIYRYFLDPSGVVPAGRRQVELTLMMVQLVASRRGVAALPNWAVYEFVQKAMVQIRPLGRHGFWATLYCATRRASQVAYMRHFIEVAGEISASHLQGIESLSV